VLGNRGIVAGGGGAGDIGWTEKILSKVFVAAGKGSEVGERFLRIGAVSKEGQWCPRLRLLRLLALVLRNLRGWQMLVETGLSCGIG